MVQRQVQVPQSQVRIGHQHVKRFSDPEESLKRSRSARPRKAVKAQKSTQFVHFGGFQDIKPWFLSGQNSPIAHLRQIVVKTEAREHNPGSAITGGTSTRQLRIKATEPQ